MWLHVGMVDKADLKSSVQFGRAGSNPAEATKSEQLVEWSKATVCNPVYYVGSNPTLLLNKQLKQ